MSTSSKSKKETKRENYETLLQRAAELRGAAGEATFSRITLLTEVFEDRQWREDKGNVDDQELAKLLDEYVEDLALPFLTLKTMLEHFPDEKVWADGKLRSMHSQMLKERSQPEREIKRRRRASVDELEKAKEKIKEYKTKVTDLESKLTQAQERIRELELENQTLREGRKAA